MFVTGAMDPIPYLSLYLSACPEFASAFGVSAKVPKKTSGSALALSLSHVFLAALNSFAGLHLLGVGAHLHSLNAFCLLASLHAIASALYGFARFDFLNVLARLAFLHATTLHGLFARLNAL